MSNSFSLTSRGSYDSMEVMRELQHASDRAAAIVGGSVLEVALNEALIAHMHKHKKITDRLFKPSQALGPFGTKIHLGLLIGLYGPIGHSDLSIMKDIRNEFAHKLAINDFESKTIVSMTKKLKLCDRYVVDTSSNARVFTKQKNKLVKDFDYWVGLAGRDETIKTSRGRFLLSLTALTYGLMTAHVTGMPKPQWG